MTGAPLPESIANACIALAQTNEPILLVGAGSDLLERVARRIHDLASVNRTWPPRSYVAESCRGKLPNWATGTTQRDIYVQSRLEGYLSYVDTVHLSDVESVSDEGGNEIMAKLYNVGPVSDFTQKEIMAKLHEGGHIRARLIFSSTVEPEQWPGGTPKEALLGVLRKCRRFNVGAAVNDSVPDPAGLTVEQDDNGRWIFELNGKQSSPVSGKAHGFHYLKILLDSPGKEFTPKELRDRLNPRREPPKIADSDRARVRNAVHLVLDPKKNIPSDVRNHLNRSGHLKIGTVCVYRPVPK